MSMFSRLRSKLQGDPAGLNSQPTAPASSWTTAYGGAPLVTTPPLPDPGQTDRPPARASVFSRPPAPTSITPRATAAGGYTAWGATPSAAPDPVAHDRQARGIYGQLHAAGHQLKWQGNTLMIDGRPYELGDGQPSPAAPPSPAPWNEGEFRDALLGSGLHGAGASQGLRDLIASQPSWAAHLTALPGKGDKYRLPDGRVIDMLYATDSPQSHPQWVDPTGGGGGAPALPGWMPSFADRQQAGRSVTRPVLTPPWGFEGPTTYQPGAIGLDDIPSFTPESLQAQLANPPLDAYMGDLLAHPSTLDDHAVDTMKAQLKDTLAEQQQFEDQDLLGMGAAYGIGESPWLASARAASDRSRNQAIATGNANIDLQAAQQRQSDRLNVASAASAYQGQRGQQLLDTVNAGVNRAVTTGNRLALRESVGQAAAASGQSAERLMADWIQANAGLDLDYARLSQQDRVQLEDLMYKMAALQQADAQFGARFNQDQSNWEFENGLQTPSYMGGQG